MICMNRAIGLAAMLIGLTLLAMNLYGLTQDLRPGGLTSEHMRFGERDQVLSQTEFNEQVVRKRGESDAGYADRLVAVIADGMAHIDWERYPIDQFHQRVPIWENYILWAMSWLTPIPEYDRYNFVDISRSIARGIGICGGASMLMSELLADEGIEHRMVTVPGHVMIEARIGSNWQIYDPDFGVATGLSVDEAMADAIGFAEAYRSAGRYDAGVTVVIDGLARSHRYWDGVSHFVTKKYYFEKIAYLLKWFMPFVFVSAALLHFRFVADRIIKR